MKSLLLALLPLAAGCGAIPFDVSQEVPTQTIQGSPLGGVPDFPQNPFPITINVSQETDRRGTGLAHSADLKSVVFRLLPHEAPVGSFDFVDELHLYIASQALPKVEVARLAPVPKGLTTMSLDIVPKVDLLPYIKAGATVSGMATGHQPTETTRYDGTVVVTVRI